MESIVPMEPVTNNSTEKEEKQCMSTGINHDKKVILISRRNSAKMKKVGERTKRTHDGGERRLYHHR